MNVIDIVAVIFAVIALIDGCRKGLVRAICNLAALIGSILLARKCSYLVGPWLGSLLDKADPKVIQVLSFVVVMIAAYVLLCIIVKLIDKAVKEVFLGWLNRLLGGVLSFLISFFVLSILLNVYEAVDKKHALIDEQTIENSICYDTVLHFAPTLWPMLGFDAVTWPQLPSIGKEQEQDDRVMNL